MKPRVAFIENQVPDYRRGFFRRLAECERYEFTVFSSEGGSETGLPNIGSLDGIRFIPVAATGLQRAIAIQMLPVCKIIRNYDCAVVYGNPRFVVSAATASIRELIGKPTIIRNHYKTAGKQRLTERIRLLWMKQFKNILVYSDAEVHAMRKDGFVSHHLVGWGNGLDSDLIESERKRWSEERLSEWQESNGLSGSELVVSIGRLLPKNRFDLMLRAIPNIRSERRFQWVVIGDGAERAHLETQVRAQRLEHCVKFLGAMFDESKLAPWMMSASVLVHPGAIGLTAIHALNYGLPVVTHSDARHQMPEFFALEESVNAMLFQRDEPASLSRAVSDAIKTWGRYTNQPSSQSKEKIALDVKSRFSTSVMADRTIAMLDTVLAGRTANQRNR